MPANINQTFRILLMRAEALAGARWATIASGAGSRRMRPEMAGAMTHSGRDPYAPGTRPIPGKELFFSTFVELDMQRDDVADIADEQIDRAGYMLEEQVRAQLRERSSSMPTIDLSRNGRLEAVFLENSKGPIRVRSTVLTGSSKLRLDFELLLRVVEQDEMQRNTTAQLVPHVAAIVATSVDTCPPGRTTRVLVAVGDVATVTKGQTKVAILIGVGDEYAAHVEGVAQQLAEQARGEEGGGSTEGHA